jgi:hypothetical protein
VGQRGRRRKVKTVRHTLGTTIELTLEDARTLAMEVVAQIRRGGNPNAAIATPGAQMWTVERMCEEYMNDLRAREHADVGESAVRALPRARSFGSLTSEMLVDYIAENWAE